MAAYPMGAGTAGNGPKWNVSIARLAVPETRKREMVENGRWRALEPGRTALGSLRIQA